MMIRLTTICLFGLAFAHPTQAAESYDNCTGFIDALPATIATQGTWCLRGHVGTAITTGNAITVNANNVTIDCNNFKIGGLAAGPATQATGIQALDRINVVVQHCAVRGFRYGIQLTGSYHRVLDNALDLNTYIGIYVIGDGSLVRGNLVSDTGGSPFNTAYGIVAYDKVDIIGNAVYGVTGTAASNGSAFAIYTFQGNGSSVNENRISGLVPAGTGMRYGIHNDSSGFMMLRDNNISADTTAAVGDIGIRCTNTQAMARDNIILGFVANGTPIANCLSYSNATN